MHDCHRPDSTNSDSQTCRFLCSRVCVCVCTHKSGGLYIQPKYVSQSIFPNFILFTCMHFIQPSIFIWGCVETFGCPSQIQAASVQSHIDAMYNPSQQSTTRQRESDSHVKAKKTRTRRCKNHWEGASAPYLLVWQSVKIFSIIQLGGLRSQRWSSGLLTYNLLWQHLATLTTTWWNKDYLFCFKDD